MARIVVGISGASGMVLARRLIEALVALEHDVEMVMTREACRAALEEMGTDFATPRQFVHGLPRVVLHQINDVGASMASGSYHVDAMCVIPCSMATLAALACGLCDNLLRRAADVTLKERRRLVVVPREAPLHQIHLENMLKLARCGATILPPMPVWYTKPQTMEEMEQGIVAKVLDALGVKAEIAPRWPLPVV